jgi:hypothetical protein
MRNDVRSALAPAYSRAVQKQCPVLARRGAERVLVTTAEMGEISKASGKRDLRYGIARAQRIGHFAAAFL